MITKGEIFYRIVLLADKCKSDNYARDWLSVREILFDIKKDIADHVARKG